MKKGGAIWYSLALNTLLAIIVVVVLSNQYSYEREVTARLDEIEAGLKESQFRQQQDYAVANNDVLRIQDLIMRMEQIELKVGKVVGANRSERQIEIREYVDPLDDESISSSVAVLSLAEDCKVYVAGQFGLVPATLGEFHEMLQSSLDLGGETLTCSLMNGQVVQIYQGGLPQVRFAR